MSLQIVRACIERYERLLEAESDPARRAALRRLLTEAREAECLILEECRLDDDGRSSSDDARRWRMRAEEYRARAIAMHDDTAHKACLRLAQSYDALAERAGTKARDLGLRPSRPDHE
jgi:hypothetical protein